MVITPPVAARGDLAVIGLMGRALEMMESNPEERFWIVDPWTWAVRDGDVVRLLTPEEHPVGWRPWDARPRQRGSM
jgi:hypothetical protein